MCCIVRNGDHIHTNFKDMYQHLRNNGFYVEVLGENCHMELANDNYLPVKFVFCFT